MAFSDMSPGDWVSLQFPPWAQPYARLMRLDRPIGTWLLLWPCLWSVVLAAEDWIPNFWHMILFGIGAVVMRGAGCVLNDMIDRDIDGLVERTQERPLANGSVKLWQAAILLAILLLIGLCVLLQFNRLTIWLGCSSLFLVAVYPLAKRVTWWPQLILGLTFNWGALLGWTATRDMLGPVPLLLYGAGIFWTLGYDTIYAHQDKRDDEKIGVKSLALYLGERSRFWISVFYTFFLILLATAGYLGGEGKAFFAGLLFPVLHLVWQLASWKPDDPANCLERFRSNRSFGLLVFMILWFGKLL